MKANRTILLVEDSRHQGVALKADLSEGGWNVVRANDVQDALYRLEESKRISPEVDMAAVDLGIPPGLDNPLLGGIRLVEQMRKQVGMVFPIIAYTSLPPQAFDYSLAIRRLLSLRSSFIYLRPMEDKLSFADLVEYAWMGYVLVAPVPADFLPRAIADRPDPLDEKHWGTLKLLDEQVGYAQIADRMSLSVEGVKARVARIKEVLLQAGEISHDAQVDELIQWYRQKKVRYSRP